MGKEKGEVTGSELEQGYVRTNVSSRI